MNEQSPIRRPTQVTVAAGVAAAGSALLVLTLFDSMSALGSIEVRHAIAGVLADSGRAGGVTVAEAVRWLHVLMLVAGGAAAAATVLAVYTLFRHRGARIGLTLAAAVLLLTVVSGVLGVVVAVATAMLWTRPARDWFAGRLPAPTSPVATSQPPRPSAVSSAHQPLLSSADEGGGGEQPADRPPEAPGPTGSSGDERPVPPPTYGFGTPQAHQGPPSYPGPQAGYPGTYPGPAPQQGYPGQGQPSYPPPGGWPPPAYGRPAPRRRAGERPTTVTVAAVLTWLFSGIALAAFLVAVAMLLSNRNQVLDALSTNPQLRDTTLTQNQLIAAVWVACAIVVFWCVVSMVLAFFAFRGHNWARITLVVSAAVAALFALSGLPFSIAHIIVAVAVIVLLFTGGANDYFSRRRYPAYPQPPYAPPGQGYGPPPGQGYPQPPRQDEREPPRNVW